MAQVGPNIGMYPVYIPVNYPISQGIPPFSLPMNIPTINADKYTPDTTSAIVQQGIYGIQNHGVQSYLPIGEKRPLEPQEEIEIQKGLKRWWPKIGAGYATPMPELLASPQKSAAILGGIMGAMFGFLGLVAGAGERLLGIFGLVIGALIGGISGYISRMRQNENIIDLIHRFSPGATKRDMLSDPVYQADLNRAAMRASAGTGNNLLAGALIGSAFQSPYGHRRS